MEMFFSVKISNITIVYAFGQSPSVIVCSPAYSVNRSTPNNSQICGATSLHAPIAFVRCNIRMYFSVDRM